MYKFMLDSSNEKYDVYVNTISSPAGHYLSRRPQLFGLLKEILKKKKLKGPKVVVEKDMGRDIGTTDIVETTDKDTIYYAKPVKSKVYSRFAKNRVPKASSKITVIFERDDNGDYEITNTWIGVNHPPFPGHENETEKSKEFWETHALVQDAQAVQSKTITKDYPY